MANARVDVEALCGHAGLIEGMTVSAGFRGRGGGRGGGGFGGRSSGSNNMPLGRRF